MNTQPTQTNATHTPLKVELGLSEVGTGLYGLMVRTKFGLRDLTNKELRGVADDVNSHADLLAALEAAVSRMDTEGEFNRRTGHGPSFRNELEQARAALNNRKP